VFDTGTGIELTTVWGINGFYQHFWDPKWRTSIYGGYVEVDYDGAAASIINSHLPGVAGTIACGVPVGGSVTGPTIPAGGGGNACSPNSSWWQLGSRTQWNPHPDLDIGLDILWTHLNTAYKGPVTAFTGSGARPNCTVGMGCTLDDQDAVSAMFRIQRNFLP
jgi:Porin subfamily